MKLKVTSGFYAGQPIIMICDMQCHKAWGVSDRPRVYVEDPLQRVFDGRENPGDIVANEDDYAYLADSELGTAPVDPGTYEGEDAKPLTPEGKHNKWCARACERCEMRDPGESFELTDFTKRVYNRVQEDAR